MTTAIIDLTIRDYQTFKETLTANATRLENMVVLAAGESMETPGNAFVVMRLDTPDDLHELMNDKAMHPELDAAVDQLGIEKLNGVTYLKA